MIISGIIFFALGLGLVCWGTYTPRKNFGIEANYAPEALTIVGGIIIVIGAILIIAPSI